MKLERNILILYAVIIYGFIFFPTIYMILVSFNPSDVPKIPPPFSLTWYEAMIGVTRIQLSLQESIILSILTMISTTSLALLAALAYEKIKFKTGILGLVLLPVITPGAIMGIALAFYLKTLGFKPSIGTVWIAHTLWAFPFAFILILTHVSGLRKSLVQAAQSLKANGFQVFRDIEFPIIKSGIMGAAIFSFLLSFNEYSITFFVIGERETLPMYVWGVMMSGTSPMIYALSSSIVIVSFALIMFYFIFFGRISKIVKERVF